jgi:hypothetical protein
MDKKHCIDHVVEEKTNIDEYSGAFCSICDAHLGWYCPKSPDHYCHYDGADECCVHCFEFKNRADTLENKFKKLKNKWNKETAFISNVTEIMENENIQEIVKMGIPVVPLILRSMMLEENFWFKALREITGEDPFDKRFAGNMPAMSYLWIQWGAKKGLI